MAQLMPLPLTISCSSKSRLVFTHESNTFLADNTSFCCWRLDWVHTAHTHTDTHTDRQKWKQCIRQFHSVHLADIINYRNTTKIVLLLYWHFDLRSEIFTWTDYWLLKSVSKLSQTSLPSLQFTLLLFLIHTACLSQSVCGDCFMCITSKLYFNVCVLSVRSYSQSTVDVSKEDTANASKESLVCRLLTHCDNGRVCCRFITSAVSICQVWLSHSVYDSLASWYKR